MTSKIAFILLLTVGCVSKSTYLKEKQNHENEKKMLQSECDQASYQYGLQINLLEQEIKLKNERLNKFNQINPDGSLRDNKWKGYIDPPITGKEKWMK